MTKNNNYGKDNITDKVIDDGLMVQYDGNYEARVAKLENAQLNNIETTKRLFTKVDKLDEEQRKIIESISTIERNNAVMESQYNSIITTLTEIKISFVTNQEKSEKMNNLILDKIELIEGKAYQKYDKIIESMSKRIELLEEKPYKKYDKIMDFIIITVVGAILALVLTKIGLKWIEGVHYFYSWTLFYYVLIDCFRYVIGQYYFSSVIERFKYIMLSKRVIKLV